MKEKSLAITENQYGNLIHEIGQLLQKGREHIAATVNTTMVDTYWCVGRHIVEYEQGGEARAEYGAGLIKRLSKDLTRLYGKGFSRSNLIYIRRLYLTFPKSETLSHLLTWSHYFEILHRERPKS